KEPLKIPLSCYHLQILSVLLFIPDEIMQLDSSPLRAADITTDLKKQFAFLSGGRGDNGSPVIVFPEFPAFSEITDREFHNVLSYLTSHLASILSFPPHCELFCSGGLSTFLPSFIL
uniref:Uncharacterized protein n=1 Tax=Oryzias latipes TaxID=8090 RepID=A0A3B3IEB9_ORYLA